MTEAEWLTGDNFVGMLGFVRGRTSNRKQRLLACGCCRAMWDERPPPEAVTRAIRIGEWHADEGGLDEAANGPAHEELERESEAAGAAGDPEAMLLVTFARSCLIGDPFDMLTQTLKLPLGLRVLTFFHRVGTRWLGGAPPLIDRMEERRRGWSPVVREVFGNPFRPVTFSPAWRTDTAASLARQMYDSLDFSPMPILADAFQDAGCDSDDILNHCRDENPSESRGPNPPAPPHVRGCWVVDLVLGKS